MRFTKKMPVHRLGLIVLTSLLAACSAGNGFSDLDAFMEATRNKPRGFVEPLPEFKAYETFQYSATDRRAPFEPPVDVDLSRLQEEAQSNVQPDLNRPHEPLEAFGISDLKMVGTLKRAGDDALWALVSDGQGGIHRVKRGNFMGKNYGRIVGINEVHIELIEIVPNGRGGWVERPRSLSLNDG